MTWLLMLGGALCTLGVVALFRCFDTRHLRHALRWGALFLVLWVAGFLCFAAGS